MRMYNYEEAQLQLSAVLNTALAEDVIIKNERGTNFRITACDQEATGKSPLEGIQGIKANVTTQELVEIIREGRSGV
jgi:hypothetical protein